MTIRLLFALVCTLFLLVLMPYLNKGRKSTETPIVSYRLHTFETKLNTNLKMPEPENKLPEEKKLDETPELSLNMPQMAMMQTNTPVDMAKMSSPVFSSNALVLNAKEGSQIPKTGATNLEAPVVGKVTLHTDGADHLLYGPKPATPLRARQLGLNGKVLVQFEVSEKGVVENIKVINSSHEMFQKPVINAVKQYKFRVFLDEKGQPIRVSLSKEFDFEIQ